VVDGTLIACANYPGCRSLSEFAGHASYGYCPSKSLFVWGMRLVLISDSKGVPVGYDLTGPTTGQERERPLELAAAHAGSAVCRQGLLGQGVLRLHGADRYPAHHTRAPPGSAPRRRDRQGALRLVIESVFSNLKRQMRLEDHLAKTLAGLVQRIAQRLLAVTLAMHLNLLSGRPPRALAYDGR
jgi:hypothetical protein